MALTIIKATGVDVVGLSVVIGGGGPKITSIGYLGNDTATEPAGGATITLNGSGFVSGFKILINGVQVSVVSFVSSTQVTFISPVRATGTYILYLINPDGGTAVSVPGIEYSGVPSWTTVTGSLASQVQATSINVTVAATSDSAVSYSLFSGTLPAGVTLNSSTGVISGTTPAVISNTTYNFVIRATDTQNQDTDRSFSITVNAANAPLTVQYLVVAGGGSAGSSGTGRGASSGGGAGGFLEGTTAVGSTLTVSVGAGGATTLFLGNSENPGNNGTDSSIVGANTVTATGGGGGAGSQAVAPAKSGGSGGGGGWAGQSPGGTGILGQGFAGASTIGTQYAGGGGGGAGGVGGPDGGTSVQIGGAGKTSSISGGSISYAGGGGSGGTGTIFGGNWIGGTATAGGGAGTVTGNGNAATVNLGGGGGGTAGGFATTSTGGTGGAGGSGIVILRYADTYDAAASTTGSPTITVAGGYRVYKFTASGSITF